MAMITDKAAPSSSSSVVDWTNLPDDLLGMILGRLIHLSGYIRFGAVCKSWLSVALDHKQQRKRVATKEPPLLLIITPNKKKSLVSSRSFKLYSIGEFKVYDYEFQLPAFRLFVGSAHGWLVFEEFDYSLTLLNPFTSKTIHLPALKSVKGWYNKVILSCDPSTNPNDLVVAAISYRLKGKVAFIRANKKRWTLASLPYVGAPNAPIDDILFYRGMLYAINQTNGLVAIDYMRWKRNRHGQQLAPIFAIVPLGSMHLNPIGSHHPEYRYPYLVEAASNGALLLVMFTGEHSKPVDFKVYKLTDTIMSSSKLWVEIHKLENNDTIFLCDDNILCASSSSSPNCCYQNSIYFTSQFPFGKDIGVFHLDGRNVEKLERPVSPLTWISPLLQ